ncbi:cysteine desulfurase / selenocysteine lyase [Solimonas aquatica]|uniref:cysteine desulfurase n=1 Tax=Solimonas aquatica TaxID=489703 RepID=A0A1H9FNU6_9GAMM|nr:family 2A encapsulin nanocompartment cargo protein cysteine desulfurase [Solimonas aquatica]SEQ39597.1 cysteine desulfurase / selenocysteine lyase [Solimonas aquatica]
MTIPTATSEAPAAPGLPDLATLSRLANEFFGSLPSTAAPGASLHGVNTPPAPPSFAAPLDAPALAERAPSLAPSSTAGNGVPDHALQAAPGTQPRLGGVVTGVPQAYAAALPSVPAPESASIGGAQPPSTPYYFVGESSAYRSPPATGGENRISAQPYALPGQASLAALLAELSPPSSTVQPAQRSTAPYYFTEHALPRSQGAVPALPASRAPFDVHAVRRDFPILAERVNGRPLIWLDNAATTQKPQAVIDRLAHFYAHENSNIHRAAHELAARATDAYEAARQKVARFLGASSVEEIIFVRGATEAINLVAQSWGRQHIGKDDEIIVSHLEHHANIVPWQMLAAEKGAKLRVIPVDDSGQIRLDEYQKLLNERTRLVAVTQVSNALGTVVPVQQVVELGHRAGACVLIDGAQAVSHLRVNLQQLGADFYVFSGHKVFGPTGIGVVYGKREILEATQPWQGGGNMIQDVTFEKTVYHGAPARFEAGTGNIADAVGLGAALDYLERIGLENVARYEHDLLAYATQGLRTVPGLHLIGTAADKTSVASFVLDGYKTEEVGKLLNQDGIAVRAGHHCAQPILRRFGVEATVRPSLAFYNTCEEVDVLIASLHRLAAAAGRRR